MDILIKSFNRPYYLDRCLFSIFKYVKNFDGTIIIMDDGTPQKYLDKIFEKYPEVKIVKSDMYNQKQVYTLLGKRPIGYEIPVSLWVNTAKKASENFILIEDDTWFVDIINIKEIEREVTNNGVVITKLFWLGNPLLNQNKKEETKENIVLLVPKLYTIIPALYYFIFYKFDRFKIRKTLRFLKINTEERRLAYYTIYAVAGMVFNKEFYVKLWDNHKNKVDEGLQHYNALKLFYKEKSKLNFARYKKEILKTGFMSSATNEHKEKYEGNIDMFLFNKLLNDAWLNNELDVLTSLPNDISEQSIATVIENDSFKRINAQEWIAWKNDFRNQYLSIGCVID
jgi:hypothetical protein